MAYDVDACTVHELVLDWPLWARARFQQVLRVFGVSPWSSAVRRSDPLGRFCFLPFEAVEGAGIVYAVIAEQDRRMVRGEAAWLPVRTADEGEAARRSAP